MKTSLIVDGNSILNRAYYGVRPLTTKDGLFTNALFGITSILLKQLDAAPPDYAAVAFDLPKPTFRHLQYDQYKAGRRAMPDELAMQMPYSRALMSALGFAVIDAEGYEADDILGTLAANAPADTLTYILTGDRDSLQLISESCHVLLAGNAETAEYDEAAFFTKYGVKPSQFVDVKALMGDSSDNIPGVAGIGEKTALKLIAEMGSLDGVYADIENAPVGKSAKEKLAAGKDSAYQSQFLARIKTDVPLNVTEETLKYSGFRKKELKELLTRFEFHAFEKRLALDDPEIAVESVAAKTINAEELDAFSDAAVYIDGESVYISDGENSYVYNEGIVQLKSFFEQKSRTLTVFDIKNTRSKLADYGIDFTSDKVFDVMLAAYLINPSETVYDIARLSQSYLDMGCAGEGDKAALIYRLKEAFLPTLTEQHQDRLFNEIEMPLAPVLSDMERIGFKVDLDGLKEFSARLGKVADERTEEIYSMSGTVFNINSPKQLGEVLFDTLKLPPPKKTKTGYSTSAEVLEKLRPYHPIIDKIFEYRQVVKLKSTYADGLQAVADENARVHTTFNQTVTNTGRLSSTEPNLQNIPIRTELGREMRRFFITGDKDRLLVDADYSQIELRLLASISGDENMIAAFLEGDDIHSITASQVFGVPLDAVTPELRKRAKAVNFGIVYGIGDFSLAADIGVTRKEAGEYIKSYLARYPKVGSYMDDVKSFAKENGFVSTLYGRRRYIPELTSSKASLRAFGERVAMNSPIQGTAADIIKIAMINVSRELKRAGIDAQLILQVHDELIIESARSCADQAAEILKSCMENAAELPIPLTAEVEIGETWFV